MVMHDAAEEPIGKIHMGVVHDKTLVVGSLVNDLLDCDLDMTMRRIGDTIGRYLMVCDGIVLDASAER